jgi:hypothetical protein
VYSSAYYGAPYSGGVVYSASSFGVPYYYSSYAGTPYAVGYAPAYSYSYRPYWGGGAYFGPRGYYYGGFRRGWYW